MQRGCVFGDPLPMPFINEGRLHALHTNQQQKTKNLVVLEQTFRRFRLTRFFVSMLGGDCLFRRRGISDLSVNS